MTSAIELLTVKPKRLLVKRTTCPHTEIGPAFAKAISMVGKCMRASAGQMASMPMAVYTAWRETDCDLSVGCEVKGDIELSDGCEWYELAGGEAAFASHFGPYTTLKESHEAIHKWVRSNGFKMTDPSWEAYPTDPGQEPDSSKWQTDIYYGVRKA